MLTTSLRTQFLILAGASALLAAVVGFVAWRGADRQRESQAEIVVHLQAVQNHMDADMMHDALRGDLLDAFHEARAAQPDMKRIEASIAEHCERFRDNMKKNDELPLDADVRRALVEARPALESYIDTARELTALAFSDLPAAEARLSEFNEAFETLEGRMEQLGSVIGDRAVAVQESARALSESTDRIVLGAIAFGALAILGLGHAIARGVGRRTEKLAQAVEHIAAGDLAFEMEHGRGDELGRIALALDGMRATLDVLLRESSRLIEAARAGELSVRADATELRGSYRDLCNGMNELLDGVARPMAESSAALDALAAGDLSRRVSGAYRGEYARVAASVNQTIEVLHALVAQMNELCAASAAGRLDVRADAAPFHGAYRELCQKTNEMLESVLAPIHESSAVLERMAHGDLSVEVRGDYRGGHETIKRNLNETLRVLRALLAETSSLIVACRAGELAKRIDSQRFDGSYRELCNQVNLMLEAVVAPMRESSDVLARVADKDLTVRMRGNYQGDHALVQRAVNTAVERMQQALSTIGEEAQALGGSSTALTSVSAEMEAKAEAGASQVVKVSSATGEISKNIQTVASAADQLNAAIREIAQRSAEASRIASSAVDVVRDTNTTVTRLGESSAEIESVIKLITSIAAQTNLLALNATIEAARAGEAGRGFAVVANEVKELANQTSKATEEISAKISTIQTDTRSSVEAMARIQEVIARINDLQTSIAGAVEEQSATTQEITRNVSDVAHSASGIAESISGVSEVAQAASTNAEHVAKAAAEIARMSSELRTLVAGFRCTAESPKAASSASKSAPRTSPSPAAGPAAPLPSKPASAANAPSSGKRLANARS